MPLTGRRPIPSEHVSQVSSQLQKPRRPPRWPSGIQYTCSMNYHSSVSAPIRLQLCPNPNPRPANAPVHTTPVVIRPITVPSHPASGQYGLFASKKILPRSFIIDYVGEVHCDDRPDSDYDLSLYRAEGVNVGVDASRMGNEARFINDYRGVNPKPNAVFQEYRTPGGELRMAVWSSTDSIKKGEEILVSYGKY